MLSTLVETLGSTYEVMAQTCNELASVVKAASTVEHAIREGWIQEILVPLGTTRKKSKFFPATSLSPMISVAPSHLHHQYHVPPLPAQCIHTYNSFSISQIIHSPTKKGRCKPCSPCPKKVRREFTPLPCPISHMLVNLVNEGYLQLFPPKLPPNPLPKMYNEKKH